MRAARLSGLEEIDAPVSFRQTTRDIAEFSDAYEDMAVMLKARSGAIVAKRTLRPKAQICSGPIKYIGQDEVRADLENLKKSLNGAKVEEAFVTAISPSNLELYYENRYYASAEEYLTALADAMREEYKAIVDAGFLLQIDDPRMADALQPRPRRLDRGLPQVHRAAGRGGEPRAARHSRPTACASTPATASTSRRACTTSSSSTSPT